MNAAARVQQEPTPKQVVRLPELARRLDISRRHAYMLVTRGDIRSVRAGRLILIPLDAIAEFLAGGR